MNEEVNDNESFEHSNKGRTDDIFECGDCGHQGHALGTIETDWVPRPFGPGSVPMHTLGDDLTCEECGSKNVKLFVKRPTKSQLAAHSLTSDTDRAEHLTEIDPDWRDRFNGQVDIAWEFYYGG